QSRIPGLKQNLIQTQRRDVKITGAMVSVAAHGMYPGVSNPLGLELHDRIEEMLADWEQSFIRGIANPLGAATDYQYMNGALSFLGRTNPAANTTAVPYNAGGAALNDLLVNA